MDLRREIFDFSYSLNPRSQYLKIDTWPLLDVPNPPVFAPTGVLFSVSQILLVKLEAQVPPGSVYFLYMCSILARLTRSRDDFPVLHWKARAQKIFADSWSICESRSHWTSIFDDFWWFLVILMKIDDFSVSVLRILSKMCTFEWNWLSDGSFSSVFDKGAFKSLLNKRFWLNKSCIQLLVKQKS